MGTNYYVVKSKPTITSPIHIGKSSMGWLFCFERHNDTWNDPPVIWNTFNQVKAWLRKYVEETGEYVIIDEYDEIHSVEDFLELVDSKQKDPHCKSNPDNFAYSSNIDGYRFTDREFS